MVGGGTMVGVDEFGPWVAVTELMEKVLNAVDDVQLA
jgi:hypothetical protein